jgi:hypothetical protein
LPVSFPSLATALKVAQIGDRAFSGTAIKSITIPRQVQIRSSSRVSNCDSLSSISFETHSELTRIESKAFLGCSSLKSITIPRHVQIFCSECFSDCKSLSSIFFESACELKRIEAGVLTEVRIPLLRLPAKVSFIDPSNFRKAAIESVVVDPENDRLKVMNGFLTDSEKKTLIRYIGSNSQATVPKMAQCLGSFCFSGLRTLVAISFEPDSQLNRIETHCFEDLKLNSLCLPPTVKFVDIFAFRRSSIKSFSSKFSIQQDQLLINDSRVLGYFLGVAALVVPDNVSSLGTKAFFECRSLKKVLVPENAKMEVIESCCFASSSIEEFECHEGIRHLREFEDSCFENSLLKCIGIPGSVKVLGPKCFFKCAWLVKVEFAGRRHLDSIGELCFASTGIKSLVLCRQVRSVHAISFRIDSLRHLRILPGEYPAFALTYMLIRMLSLHQLYNRCDSVLTYTQSHTHPAFVLTYIPIRNMPVRVASLHQSTITVIIFISLQLL